MLRWWTTVDRDLPGRACLVLPKQALSCGQARNLLTEFHCAVGCVCSLMTKPWEGAVLIVGYVCPQPDDQALGGRCADCAV